MNTLAATLESALIGQATKADVIAACDAELNGSRPTAGRKETEMRVSKFTRKSAVYVCVVCEKQTRETGDGESSVEMCADCYEWESMLNQHGDDGHGGNMNECEECMSQMLRPANIAKRKQANHIEESDNLAALRAERDELRNALTNIVLNFDMGDFIITVAANGIDEPEHPANLDYARAVLAKYAGKEK